MVAIRQVMTSVGMDKDKGNPPALLVGMYIGAAAMENSTEGPKKIKNRATIWSSSPTSRCLF